MVKSSAFASMPVDKGGMILWLKQPTKINETIEFLGTHELCLYLVRGDDAMIVGGGMSHVTPTLDEQLDALDLDPLSVKYLVLTHSHFDHCGALPYFRYRFPGLQVLGTSAAQDLLSRQKVVDYNAEMNDAVAKMEGLWAHCVHLCEHVEGLSVDRVVGDGETLDLGRGTIAEFYDVPGHSKCCLATYLPSCNALFPTDTMPHPFRDWRNVAFPSAQYDFATYVASLRRLNEFDVRILCLDHHGVLLDDQATEYLRLGLDRTLEFREHVLGRYAATDDLDAVAWEVTREALPMVGLPFITEDLMFVITRAMVKSIVSG